MKNSLAKICKDNEPTKSDSKVRRYAARVMIAALFLLFCWSAGQAQGNMNGHGGQMPAYYDGDLFTVNMKEMPNSDPLLANNKSINTIYATNDLDEEQDFIPVIDAIQGEGFNPLWRQVLIVFNEGFTPRQFTSDEEVLDAAEAGEITLVETDEVYRCSVVGGH